MMKQQCIARNKRTGALCTRSAVEGKRLCANHGGTKTVENPTMIEAIAEISKFVAPISPSHPNANPLNGFFETWRYNEGRILFLQEKVESLPPEDLVWGKSKEERMRATEFPGTNITHEAKKNIWLVLLDEALDQRMKLLTLAAKLGIEKAKLESAQGLKSQTVWVILESLKILGVDVSADETKAAIRQAIATATGQNMRGTLAEQIVPADHPDSTAYGWNRKQIVKGEGE